MKKLKTGILILLSVFTVGLYAQNYIKAETSSYDIFLEISSGGTLFQNNVPLNNLSKITVAADSTQTFKILPNTGYEVSELKLNGVSVKNNIINNMYTTPPISSSCTLKVDFKIKQYRLSVKTGDGVAFILLCDYGSTPSFDVTPPNGKVISSVLFNNTDITSSVINGICTVPYITTNSSLIVTYADISTSLNNQNDKNQKIYSQDSNLVIENSNNGEIISIYSTLGKQIKSITSDGNTLKVPLQKGMIYIVKTSIKTYKVVI